MALIKCPECGKEIPDQAENCPNCGYPIKNQSTNNVNNNQQNSNKLNDSQKTIVALNKKTKYIIAGAVCCLVILIGALFYMKTNITLSDEERAVVLSINELQNNLNVSNSISVDNAITVYYDPEYEQLKTTSELTEDFSQEMILCLLKYNDGYEAFAYDTNGNLIFSTDVDDTYSDLSWDNIQSNFSDEPNNIKQFTKEDIVSLVKKTNGKNIKLKHTSKKHSDRDKEELLNKKFDEAAQNDDIDYMKKCINDYAMNDSQKEDLQNKLYKYYYDTGCKMIDSGNYMEARGNFALANNYGDTETQIKRSYYEEAKNNQNEYDPDRLIELYREAGDYSDAKDEIKRVESYKIYLQNVDKLQSEDVTLDDLKNLRPFFEEYKDTGNCQQICDYIDTMEKSPYLGKWELSNKTSEDLYDVKQYLNITPYWSGDNDHFRITFSNTKDEFDAKSSDIKKINTDNDSDITPNDDGTLTIEVYERWYSIGKGSKSETYEYTYKKIEE